MEISLPVPDKPAETSMYGTERPQYFIAVSMLVGIDCLSEVLKRYRNQNPSDPMPLVLSLAAAERFQHWSQKFTYTYAGILNSIYTKEVRDHVTDTLGATLGLFTERMLDLDKRLVETGGTYTEWQ